MIRKTTKFLLGFFIAFCLSTSALCANVQQNSVINSNVGAASSQSVVRALPIAEDSAPKPYQSILTPTPPNVDAKAYILIDADSGKILAEKNKDQRLPPASLTKMMTMFIVSKSLVSGNVKLDDKVLISEAAWKTGGSKMFVKVGTEVPIEKLIEGIVVSSGNDSCIAMAEHIAGSEESFAGIMNAEAAKLGMNNTHYVDSTGLNEPAHYSSAYDLSLLARAIVKDYPQYYHYYSEKWFIYNNIKQPNRNRLLWRFPDSDGIKTGHTDAAGFCLVASAKKNGMRLISVVLGAPNDEARATASISLLTYGFRFFNTHQIYQANTVVANPRVWYGDAKTVPAGVLHDFAVTVPTGQFQNIKLSVKINQHLVAPIKKGDAVGTVDVVLQDKAIVSEPIVAFADNLEGNFIKRFVDYILHLIEGMFSAAENNQ